MSCRGINFLLRADAGTSIGHGHRTRVETIARAVLQFGGEARLLSQRLAGCRPDSTDLPRTLWIPTTDDPCADARLTLSVAERDGFRADIAIVDSYLLGTAWEQEVASHGIFVVALDDFVGREHAANLVIELVPASSGPDRVSGLELLPIDPAFNLPFRPLPKGNWTVLVSFGGSDTTGHTRIALDALDLIDSDHPGLIRSALVVAGSGNQIAEALRERVASQRRRHWVGHVPSLVPFVEESDLVITAAGNTLFEALAARKTILAVVTSENQVGAAASLAADGSFICLGNAHEVTAETIKSAMLDLPGRYGAGLSVALMHCPIDTLGVERLVALIKGRWEQQ